MSDDLDGIVQRLSTLKQSLNRRSPLKRSPRRARRSPSPKLRKSRKSRKSPKAKLRSKQGSKRGSKRTYTAEEKRAIKRFQASLKKARKALDKL